MKVTVFKLSPITQPASGSTPPDQNVPGNGAQGNNGIKYQVNLTINMYSLDLSNIDEVYEYSRKRFNRFNDSDGVIFVPATVSAGTNGNVGTGGTASSNTGGNTIQQSVAKGNDIELTVLSFLFGGPNFSVNAAGARAPIKLRVKERPSVKITLNGNNIDIAVVDEGGNKYNINGRSSNENIKMSFFADFPLEIQENKRIGTDIQIINNSNKRVDLKLEDKVSRLRITDRNGNVILNQSASEKVYII